MRQYKDVNQYAKEWGKINGVKVYTVDNAKRERLPNLATIYLNRIGDKTRIIEDTTTHRNMIAVSVDTERHDLKYWRYRIQSYFKVMDNYRNGSCQQALRASDVAVLLSGITDLRNRTNYELLNQKIQPCNK